MSIWGPGPLENDDAADWLAEFAVAPSVFAIHEALDAALSGDVAYLEVSDGAVALVAAFVAADLLGVHAAGVSLEDETRRQLLASFAEVIPSAQRSLALRALRALRAIRDPERSELVQLLEEDEAVARSWHAAVELLSAELLLRAGSVGGETER
jgi:Domain of unknown function (DUF4259)